MGVQIIKRKAGKMPEKMTVNNENARVQISYNSDGHLVIRYINIHDNDEDILVVLDDRTTYALKDFVKYRLQ